MAEKKGIKNQRDVRRRKQGCPLWVKERDPIKIWQREVWYPFHKDLKDSKDWSPPPPPTSWHMWVSTGSLTFTAGGPSAG